MVVELGRAAWLVSAMLALPLLLPGEGAYWLSLRYTSVLLGLPATPVFMDGNHGAVRWTRIDAIVLILMTSADASASWMGFAMSLGALLLVGAGMHTTQTAGLALATDLASKRRAIRS